MSTPSDYVKGTLPPEWVTLGQMLGKRRWEQNKAAGTVNYVNTNTNKEANHMVGVLGEIAVAYALDIFPAGLVERDAPDNAHCEVKTRKGDLEWDLILQQKDLDFTKHRYDEPVVLVFLIEGTRDFVITGWIRRSEVAEHPEWLDNKGDTKDTKYIPSYWVPRSALHPIKELP